MSSNSWISRAGVVVGYKPEDTMKSFLFNQNNKHCLNLSASDLSILQFPKDEIERALDLLSSDSDSESSSITKITVKNVSTADNSCLTQEKGNILKNSKSGTDVEIWNEDNNSDSDCTSADISNDFADGQGDRLPTAHKSFEEILEEKLQQEPQIPKAHRDPQKSEGSSKPKFTFLKKNGGKSAWCSNVKPNRNLSDKSNSSTTRSQSSDRTKAQKSEQSSVSRQSSVRKMKSLSSMMQKPNHDSTKTDKEMHKNRQKSVHFAAATSYKCDSIDFDSKINEPASVTQINPKVAEIEEKNSMFPEESQNIDKELVEFELLEQIANVSITSSIASSIARYDEDNLREKLKTFKSMPSPITCSQSKQIDFQSKPPFEILNTDKDFHVLSVSEEKNTNILCKDNYDSELDSDISISDDDNNDSQCNSNNTTTLSEFQESLVFKHTSNPFQQPKIQGITRKISKQNERHKNSDHDNQDWTDESPFQLENKCSDKSGISSEMATSKAQNIDWTFSDPFHESESSSEDDQAIIQNRNQTQKERMEVPSLYPNILVDKRQLNPEDNINMQSAKLKQWVQLLESEVKRFKSENEDIEKMKKEKEDGLKRLEEEIKLFQKHKDEESKKFEEYKQNEIKKLKKERKVFEDYQEAMKNMPNKKDRQEIDNLKADIEVLKEESINKETRWQAANTRLKQKVEQLETENSELHSRIHALEQKRLQLQAQLVSSVSQKTKSDTGSSKPKPNVTSVSQAVSMKHSNIPIGIHSLSKEDNNNNKYVPINNKPTTQVKKSSTKVHSHSNIPKTQKQVKNVTNPFSSENGIIDIRGSAASDYYTGEEESGSVDLNKNLNTSNQLNKPEIVIAATKNLPFAVKIDRSNEVIKDEIQHPDGILERVYMNGCIDVIYPNGSLKQISADSKSIVVHLFNGDIKQITPDGRVIYFYAQDESTQTTHPNGTEEIIYKNGHKEILHTSGIREITFPDKSIKIIHPDLREETFLPNGLVIRISSSGDKEILLPNGQKEIHTNGIKKRIYPDGTTKTVYPDGRQETYYASGRMRVKDKLGNLLLDQYINKPNVLKGSN